MSVPVIVSSGAASAGAAEAARRLREEEEELATYQKDDLEGWEFKILRSVTGQFKKPEVVRQVREEESKAGWEMVEKFDDNRIRFKRKIDCRSNDHYLEIDPYRSNYGITSGSFGAIITGSIVGAVALILLIVLLLKG